ncbi:MAG: phospholipid/cholesterol/gamma-HCH transport system permease protein [Verrucomicrobiota bacterium]
MTVASKGSDSPKRGEQNAARLEVQPKERGVLLVQLAGDWRTQAGLPGIEPVQKGLDAGRMTALEFDTRELGRWDTGLIMFVIKCAEVCKQRKLDFRSRGLPKGVAKLVEISQAEPPKEQTPHKAPGTFLERVGEWGILLWAGGKEMLSFLGESVLAFLKLLRGQAQFRWADMWLVMQQCGPQALGIVALINFIVGLILAFVGATQLRRFGASVYVADLVAIAVVREMGCIMTGIILSGRTGAAFAAQLGTMKVSQEIEALRTFDISPVEFLVLPRMVALVLVMPLLCAFADLIAIAGGLLISWGMLDITPDLYLHRTLDIIELKSFLLGIVKGTYFGFVIAFTGCLRGIQCGNNAAAVGQATTSAVVTGITAIVASDGIFALICHILNI